MADSDAREEEFELQAYLDLILRRRWIVFSLWILVFVAITIRTFTATPIYQGETLLDIEKATGNSPTYADSALVEASADDYYQTQYRLLTSDSLLQQVYDTLRLGAIAEFAGPDGLGRLSNAVTVAPVPRSRLVYVRALSTDARLAAKIAQELAQEYVQQNLSNQLFISKDILQALQIDQKSMKARETFAALPAVVQSPLIQQLKAERAKLLAQQADLSRRYTPKHPILKSLEANIASLAAQIDAETDHVVQSLRTELSGQFKGNNVRIVDPAKVPRDPFRPRKLRNLLLGFFGGLIIGIFGALFVDLLDQSIRTQDDVENKLSLQFLGIVPQTLIKTAERQNAPLLTKETSLTSEAFRNLRTMVDFAEVAEKSPALLVTSTIQEEGKSFIAVNLATSFAQLGQKVLLIDGDLRRPSVHKKLQLPLQPGLTDFLVGSSSVDEIASLIKPCDVPSLSALTCGTRPPNPSELLNTPKLSALIVWARQHFDRVLVDCTPLFPISDTLLWSRHINSTVFVVRYGKTRAPLIRRGRDKLTAGGAKLLGVVIDAAQPSGLSYSSYGYYYQHYYHDYTEKEKTTSS